MFKKNAAITAILICLFIIQAVLQKARSPNVSL